MLDKMTGLIAMLGFIAAAGLDSDNWLPPFGIMVLCFGWVAVYSFIRDRWME